MYRTIVKYGLLLLLALVPAAASAQETQDTMQLAPGLRSARAASQQALSKLAAADAALHFADDIVVQFGSDEFRGKQAAGGWISQTLQTLAALRFGAARFTIAENEVTERGPYTVVAGDGTQQEGALEMVWRKGADGKWKVARLTVL